MGRYAVQQASRCLPGAASRSRWEPARGVCGQHSQLPSLSATRAVSMAGQRHHEAAPGQCPVASPRGRVCSSPLAGLESATASSSLHAPAPPATGGGHPAAERACRATPPGGRPFSCPARPLSLVVGRTAGMQCPCLDHWPTYHQADRASQQALLSSSGYRQRKET